MVGYMRGGVQKTICIIPFMNRFNSRFGSTESYPVHPDPICNHFEINQMQKNDRILFASLIFLLWAIVPLGDIRAQTQDPGHCRNSTATAFLDVNNVRAKITNNGNLFWDNTGPQGHEYPRGSGLHTIRGMSLWLSGNIGGRTESISGSYNLAGYRGGTHAALSNEAPCEPFDRIFSIGERDFQAMASGAEPSADMLDWPWHDGAPVVDGDGIEGNYNLAGGDRPLLLGDETHYWVMSDARKTLLSPTVGVHPIGMEVHGLSFASATPGFENTTFYHFRIINKSGRTLDSLGLGLLSELQIGARGDEFVGVDTTLSLVSGYNADNDDEGGYGENPPAVGIQFLNHPMKSVSAFFRHDPDLGAAVDRPQDPEQVRNLLDGRWSGGAFIQEGERGVGGSGTITRYIFPGDPVEGAFWSQRNTDGIGSMADPLELVRAVSGTGIHRLEPDDEISFFFAVINASGSSNLDSISELRRTATAFVGLRPEDVPSSGEPLSGPVPTLPPTITGLADGASGQPLDLELIWNWSTSGVSGPLFDPRDLEFELQLFHARRDRWVTTTRGQSLDLEPETSYRVKVRAMTQAGFGPWSEEIAFSTGGVRLSETNVFSDISVVANASGPLNPPEGAVLLNLGFPGQEPTSRQQLNGTRWVVREQGFGANSTFQTFLQRILTVNPSHNLPRILPYDFEIRFTEEGSFFLDNATREMGRLPFELWRTGIGTPNNTSDDVRLIPGLFDTRSEGWRLECQTGETDRYVTESISWFLPINMTPGRSGYDEWAQQLSTDINNSVLLLQLNPVMDRMILVNLDGTGDPCSPDQPLPEEGTIFRLTTELPPAAIPGAPADEAVLPSGSVSFHWSEGLIPARRLEVARDAGFTNLLLSLDQAESGRAQMFAEEPGTYWWRVIDLAGTPSEAVRFFVGTSVDTDNTLDDALPARFALGAAYPNPFTQGITIPYELPRASRVRLRLFDALGREITTLVDAELPAGRHTARFNVGSGSGGAVGRLSGGTYFYVLEAGSFRGTGQMVYLK